MINVVNIEEENNIYSLEDYHDRVVDEVKSLLYENISQKLKHHMRNINEYILNKVEFDLDENDIIHCIIFIESGKLELFTKGEMTILDSLQMVTNRNFDNLEYDSYEEYDGYYSDIVIAF